MPSQPRIRYHHLRSVAAGNRVAQHLQQVVQSFVGFLFRASQHKIRDAAVVPVQLLDKGLVHGAVQQAAVWARARGRGHGHASQVRTVLLSSSLMP